MKKVLSIMATVAAVLYLIAGIGLLVFQDAIKVFVMGPLVNSVKVYPAQDVLQLVFLGIPCVVLGILSMSKDIGSKRSMNLLLVIYSSVMLVCAGILSTIGSSINNVVAGRMMDIAGMANMSMVSACFGWIQFLINLSLVLLLLRGALKE